MKRTFKILLFVLILFFGFYGPRALASLAEVSFRLSFEDPTADQTPLSLRTVYIFNGDYEFKASAKFDPYPYGDEARKNHWLIQTVKTDNKGMFTFNIDVPVKRFYIRTGPDHRAIMFEKSTTLSHQTSETQLRIVRLEPYSTRVKSNVIYDLRGHSEKTIGLDGVSQTKPFDVVELTVQKELNDPL